ncbi:MAG: hypothetical protein Q7P63_08530 [Verrucomicrobiota bacterium JB022]|nr:hypothetical protein [Verrucomicrobiota bacterium JB022]
MSKPATFIPPTARTDFSLGLLLGTICTVSLFFLMAVALLVRGAEPERPSYEEQTLSFTPPEVEPPDEEPEPEPEQQELEPELKLEPPPLSLSQLDVALNPGKGSNLLPAGFSLASVSGQSAGLKTADILDFSMLDQAPEMLDRRPLRLPQQILRTYRGTKGSVEAYILLNEQGEVVDIRAEQSDLPAAVISAIIEDIRQRRFTKPTKDGKPVRAKAILPIPVAIN